MMKAMTTGAVVACFLVSQSVSALYRNCVYQCPGGIKTLTVSTASLCPLSI